MFCQIILVVVGFVLAGYFDVSVSVCPVLFLSMSLYVCGGCWRGGGWGGGGIKVTIKNSCCTHSVVPLQRL